ncbi:hypothetical protein [Shimia sp. R9_1]
MKSFKNDEAGAVTVDWVVLTAGIIGLAIVVFAAIESAARAPVTAAAVTLNAADATSAAVPTQ